VVEAGAYEGPSVVAALATELGRDVIGGLGHVAAREASAGGVAGRAIARRALEDATNVARLATLRRMRAGQRKAGAQVIEVAPGGLCNLALRERRPGKRCKRQQCQAPQRGATREPDQT